ncbi:MULTISPECIES: helix-turn-helix domain-containing protein [unclassified Adlercreutzia]|uniref:helix-turn-helix domain-containing protein n=1 Tax=unclassified Adlercreutzia TaxID=2636013 RepID=UPI0013EB7DCE|nr:MULTISPECIES: helix-turn-helix transcriptional regulator [unclassified Adlercreutzia]
MEFSEKLQELRKARSFTQEELACALYVSRTAVSKWESGRGYPSIDSLKQLSRFFSVSIDELICSDEIIVAAEEDRRGFVVRYRSLICGALDVLLVVLLLIPAFGNGADSTATVTLLDLTGVSPWLKAAFAALVGATVLAGALELAAASLGKTTLGRGLLAAGMVLSIVGVAAFIASRQPYAGIVCFALLVAKGFFISQGK